MTKIEAIWTPIVQQQVCRLLMGVMSRPGRIENLAEISCGTSAERAVLATLLDAEVSLCDQHERLDSADWPLLQAQSALANKANYVLCEAANAVDFSPMLGTLSSPENSTTLLLVVDSLGTGEIELSVTGPGVNGNQVVRLSGLHKGWLEQRQQWVSLFPLGVDIILLDATRVMALPRTTNIEVITWGM
tara:strand:+ start:71037 stop:71603 length:567 start_codon:yes stop_codon:yes gene_type:complete